MNDHIGEAHRPDADPGREVHATGGDRAGGSSSEAEPAITAVLVPEKQRLDFLPKQTLGHNLRFEFGAYDAARALTADYGGGYWEFYRLSNGGFYIAPGSTDHFRIAVLTNGYEGECSADALGIICSLVSLNKLIWQTHSEGLNTKYYALYNYAAEHPEAATIFGAID